MTSSVKLIKCLEAIKDHAFAASKYSVIITFEDHLSPRRQKIAAQASLDECYLKRNWIRYEYQKQNQKMLIFKVSET